MKKAKLITIWLFTILMLINLFYVPWLFISKHEKNMGTIRQAGYSWVFLSPEIPGALIPGHFSEGKKYEGFPIGFWSVQIDLYKLVAQSVAIFILFGAVFFTLNAVSNKKG